MSPRLSEVMYLTLESLAGSRSRIVHPAATTHRSLMTRPTHHDSVECVEPPIVAQCNACWRLNAHGLVCTRFKRAYPTGMYGRSSLERKLSDEISSAGR